MKFQPFHWIWKFIKLFLISLGIVYFLVLLYPSCADIILKWERDSDNRYIQNEAEAFQAAEYAAAANDFAFRAFREAYKTTPTAYSENFVFSPSVMRGTYAMAAFQNGGDGKYSSILGMNTGSETPMYRSGNGMTYSFFAFADKPLKFKKQYVDGAGKMFGAKCENLDFTAPASAAEHIDDLISDASNGMFKDSIGSSNVDEARGGAIFAGVAAFNGKWLKTFERNMTSEDDFHPADGHSARTQFMYESSRVFGFANCDGFESASLPYKRGNYQMFLIKPVDGKSISDITSDLFKKLFEESKKSNRSESNSVKIPKFKMHSSLNARDCVKALGLDGIFIDSAKNIFDNPPAAFRENSFANTFIEVDEDGTRAVSVHSTILGAEIGIYHFVADSPFMFFIINGATGEIHFMGVYAEPKNYQQHQMPYPPCR